MKAARPLIDRILEKSIPEPNSGCWLWTGAVNLCGYGTLRTGSRTDGTRRTAIASRVSYEVFYGEIPDGLHVLHRCDFPICINPEHLFLGTHTDNMRDMIQKGRAKLIPPMAKRGQDHHRFGHRSIVCVNGHHLGPDNLLVQNGVRRCKVCRQKQIRANMARYRARKKEEV